MTGPIHPASIQLHSPPCFSRIHSPCESLREATATQFRRSILERRFTRSDPIRSVRLLTTNLHTTVSDLLQFPSIVRKKMWSVLTPWDFQSPKNKSLDIVMLIRRVRLNARSTASVELEKDVVPFSPELLLHKITRVYMCVCVCIVVEWYTGTPLRLCTHHERPDLMYAATPRCCYLSYPENSRTALWF